MPSLVHRLKREVARLRERRDTPSAPPIKRPFAQWQLHYLTSYFTLAPSRFHDWLDGELNGLHLRRGTRLNVLAPRGGAKSTRASFAYPMFTACEGLEPYIILTSDTGDQAHKYLDSIRAEFEGNDKIAIDYPQLFGKGPVWREDRIRLANGVVIEALGTGTKIRGRKNRQHRPSLIVVDDPQNREHILSKLQRERSWEWLTKDVCNAGDPDTNIVVLGTNLHRECIVGLLKTTPGWRSKTWQSIITWPAKMELWGTWEKILHNYDDEEREAKARAFYEANKDAMHE